MKSFTDIKKRKTKIDRLKLLNLIHESGSISVAAKSLNVSYKAAWEAMEQINNMSELPLLDKKTGGKKGGGSTLTEHGHKFLNFMQGFEEKFNVFLKAFTEGKNNLLNEYMKTIKFQTSARNQFAGRIKNLTTGAVNSEVIINIGEKNEIVAIITNKSAENMGLNIADEIYALISTHSIILTNNGNIKTSARNQFTGKITYCQKGAVNGEVIIEMENGKTLVATITNESINNLKLEVGQQCTALFKASQVILTSI